MIQLLLLDDNFTGYQEFLIRQPPDSYLDGVPVWWAPNGQV